MNDHNTEKLTAKPVGGEPSARLAGSVQVQRIFLGRRDTSDLSDWHDFPVRGILTEKEAVDFANDYNKKSPSDVLFRAVRIIKTVQEL